MYAHMKFLEREMKLKVGKRRDEMNVKEKRTKRRPKEKERERSVGIGGEEGMKGRI